MEEILYKNEKEIAILLATYNGGQYLDCQIQSLIWQTNQDFTVYVHDDCSTDNTLDIVNSYSEKYPGQFVVVKDMTTKGRGARDSFFFLLEHIDSKYYMFCDQDDIWLPTKIELTSDRMKKEETRNPGVPIMVYSDLLLVDQKAVPTGQTLWEKAKMKSQWYDTIKANYVWLGRYWGCTIMMNKRAKDVSVPIDNRSYGHDIWAGLMVNLHQGKCVGMDCCTILYRQHSQNTSGGVPSFNGSAYYRKRLGKILHFYHTNKKMYLLSHELAGCNVWQFVIAKLHLILGRFF